MSEEYVAPEGRVPGPSTHEEPVVEKVEKVDLSPVVETQSRLAQTIEALNRSVTGGTESARLMADPNIREYLTAKANGRKMKLVDEAAIIPTEKEETPPDFETMKNSELIQWMDKQNEKRTESLAKRIATEQMQTLRSEIEPHLTGLKAVAMTTQNEKVSAEIKVMKEKHSDFDTLRNDMLEVNKTVEGLSLEELYTLTKVRKGLPFTPQVDISTERPSQLPGPRSQTYKSPSNITGRSGFANILKNALSRDDRN